MASLRVRHAPDTNTERSWLWIREQYSDGNNGRCAIGVLMSYFGWDGKHRFDTTNTLHFALYALKKWDSHLYSDRIK